MWTWHSRPVADSGKRSSATSARFLCRGRTLDARQEYCPGNTYAPCEESAMPKRLGIGVVGFDHWYTVFGVLDEASKGSGLKLVAVADSSRRRLAAGRGE